MGLQIVVGKIVGKFGEGSAHLDCVERSLVKHWMS